MLASSHTSSPPPKREPIKEMIDGLTIPGVARAPVVISGEWLPAPKRDWRGVASASEPIVAVSFLRWGHHIEWCLSERPTGNESEVRLALFPYDRDGCDVQVNTFLGGGGQRWRSLVSSAQYRPTIPLSTSLETGRVLSLSRIEGNPCVEFFGLFLAKRDTKGGRNGIWHIRPCFREGLPPALSQVLTFGRTGIIEDK
jgi:hypothetical protein